MTASNTNLRSPPIQNAGSYPYVTFTQFRNGSWDREDATPGSDSYAIGHKMGGYEETGGDGSHRHFAVGMKHEYNQQGSTTTTELNSHEKTGGGTVHQVSGDSHSENAGGKTHAISNDNVTIAGGMEFKHASGGNQQTSANGDLVMDHTGGNHHLYLEGDKVTFIQGTDYTQVGQEYGLYAPNGNMDFMASGNIQISCQNFTINAAMSVQINTPFGQITVNNQGITITALIGNAQINSISAAVVTNGSLGTFLQGGGPTASPLTIN